jgi:hypothetical protein
VFDITVPSAPVGLTERLQTSGVVKDLVLDTVTERLYVADWDGGLEIWDVAVPAAPVRLGVCMTPRHATAVDVVGAYAYVADWEDGLCVISIANPSAPVEVGRYDTPSIACDVAKAGDYAYVADNGALLAIGVADPAHPSLVGVCDSLGAVAVAVEGRYAYVACAGGLRVVDLLDPANPVSRGVCPTRSWGVDIALIEHYAYVSDYFYGLIIIDVTDPDSPTEANSMYLGCGRTVRITKPLACALGSELVFLDVTDALHPRSIGVYQPNGLYGGVVIANGHAYLTDAAYWLLAIDISDPSNTHQVGQCQLSGAATDVVARGQYLYVGTTGSGLSVVDISDPDSPREVGNADDIWPAERVALTGNLACIAAQMQVSLVDVSVPSAPRQVGAVTEVWYASSAEARDTLVYIADASPPDGGLRIVSVADPANPRQAALLHPPVEYTPDVALTGTVACVAGGDSGVQVIDVSDPAFPTLRGRVGGFGATRRVAASGQFAYVAAASGFTVVSVADPDSPRVVGYYRRANARGRIVADGGYIYFVDGAKGLCVCENLLYGVAEPGSTSPLNSGLRLLRNPVVGRELEFEYRTARETPVAFELLDACGRSVAALPARQPAIGANRYQLELPEVCSGVYALRANSTNEACGVKLVLVRP